MDQERIDGGHYQQPFGNVRYRETKVGEIAGEVGATPQG
jgi:hypothetical protein